ncbi:MAG TPA: DmsE family decaheme c-type cytochrome [Vicinamibacterales bacterium]|jgi:DmsE family decaheme c-type cytochrome
MGLTWNFINGGLAVVVFSLPFALAGGTSASAGGQPAQKAPAAGEYAGEATCLTCHEDHSYKGTAHGLALNERTPAANRGCESCHGPGKAHADSGDPALIRNFKTTPASEVSATCTTCHNRAGHALWAGSQHDQRTLSCTTCHSVHTPKGPSQIKAPSQRQLCGTCHRNVVNRTHRFSHMPVREGALTCSSCHNPHGSQNVRLLRTGTNTDESCTSCHTDKRGPYLWEHAPVSESCVTCHEPHGSNNERMLVSKLPFLCQRCHVTSRHPPTVYEGFLLQNSPNANKIYARSCTFCHQQVHGSNAPSGKFLLR